MSEGIKAAISELQEQIRRWEQEIQDTKRVINTLRIRSGEEPLYPEADFATPGSTSTLRRDQFYGKTMASAIREYLQLRKGANLGPASVQEIYAALSEGGFNFGTGDPSNAKRIVRITLTKNSSLFHRLPDRKHFGLTEWYPDLKRRRGKRNEAVEESAEESENGDYGGSDEGLGDDLEAGGKEGVP